MEAGHASYESVGAVGRAWHARGERVVAFEIEGLYFLNQRSGVVAAKNTGHKGAASAIDFYRKITPNKTVN